MSMLQVIFSSTTDHFICLSALMFRKIILIISCAMKLDNFGNTPLLEAIKTGNDRVASLLVKQGASLKIDDAGSFLCTIVAKGDSDFLRRLLLHGADPNSKDYDLRTALHIAASQGFYLMAKLLLEAGANVFSKDRCILLPCSWMGLLILDYLLFNFKHILKCISGSTDSILSY